MIKDTLVNNIRVQNLRVIDLFAGIGGIRLGFEEFGCKSVFSSEIDSVAQKMYHANFGETPHGDITKIDPLKIPDHDILLAGFPCQPFSIIGSMNGFFDTRGTLFFYIEKILEVKKPRVFLLENVKNLKSHDKGRTFNTIIKRLEGLKYKVYYKILNALDFGLPQKRERTFIVGFKDNIKFEFPKPVGSYKSLNEILEHDSEIDPSLFASVHIVKKRLDKVKNKKTFCPSIWHENKGGNVSVLPFSCALRHSASYNYLLVNGKRRLSSREMLRLQGYPDDFKIVVSNMQMRQLAGNSVAVPVIKAVAKQMLKAISEKKSAETQKELFKDEFKSERSQICVG
ncbi:MAG: DNA cytosine methyltransferase [Candidatus Omnitrophota bacterium]